MMTRAIGRPMLSTILCCMSYTRGVGGLILAEKNLRSLTLRHDGLARDSRAGWTFAAIVAI
jgi:hypothetical protein